MGELVEEDVGGEVSGGVAGRESGEANGDDLGDGDRERRCSERDADAVLATGALGGESMLGSFDQGMFKSFTVCTF